MANASIFNAFKRMWQHTVAALNNKIDSHNSSTSAHTDIRNLANSKLGSSSEINGGTW